MPSAVKRPAIEWPFVPTKELCHQLGVSTDTLKDWRVSGVLQKGIYWTNFPYLPSRTFWNRDLVRDWFVNGRTAAHDLAVEKYLASLPSSDDYAPKTKTPARPSI